MQVILDSSFARPGSAPIWGGKKVEFRDWTTYIRVVIVFSDNSMWFVTASNYRLFYSKLGVNMSGLKLISKIFLIYGIFMKSKKLPNQVVA